MSLSIPTTENREDTDAAPSDVKTEPSSSFSVESVDDPRPEDLQKLGELRLSEQQAPYPLESKLCEECKKLIKTCEREITRFSKRGYISPSVLANDFHGGDESAIHAAADTGCAICFKVSIWLHSLPPSSAVQSKDGQHETPPNRVYLTKSTKMSCILMVFTVRGSSALECALSYAHLSIFGADLLTAYTDLRQSERDRSTCCNTGGNISLQLARLWLQACQQQHAPCSAGRDYRFKPPRLLDLRESVVRLVDGSAILADSSYAALSHCWGDAEAQLKLTSSNRHRFGGGIETSSLPKTFQDAVTVCRALEIEYLWIDSLCILQSDPELDLDILHAEDWHKHVDIMGEIYENCKINIAAAHGINATAGLFVERDPALILPGYFLMRDGKFDAEGAPKWSWRLMVEPSTVSNVSYTSIGHFHLDQRGWVTQERLLSPRTIHFSDTQIFWECSEVLIASESHPFGSKTNEAPPYGWKTSKDNQPARWLDILRDYTARTLTKSEDMLPAIAGIANRIQAHTNDDYIAGIFRSALPQALLWAREYESPYFTRAAAQTTPTWSWASVLGKIDFHPCKFDSEVTYACVQEVIARPLANDNSDTLTQPAQIKIRGPFASVPRCKIGVVEASYGGAYYWCLVEGLCFPLQDLAFDTDISSSTWTIVYLLVISWVDHRGYYEEKGLILVADPSDEAHFRRVGRFRREEHRLKELSKGDVYDEYRTVILV